MLLAQLLQEEGLSQRLRKVIMYERQLHWVL